MTFERLANENRSKLLGFARGLKNLIGVDDPEDLLQESLLKAFGAWSTYANTASFSTWMCRIILNTAISRKRRLHECTGLCGLVDKKAVAALSAVDTKESVHAALSLLRHDDLELVRLCDIEDQSYEEVAKIYHVPVGTIKSRLHRARHKVREGLQAAGLGAV